MNKLLLIFLVAMFLLIPTVAAQESNLTINVINEETLANITQKYMQFSTAGSVEYFANNKSLYDNTSFCSASGNAYDYDFTTNSTCTREYAGSGYASSVDYINGTMNIGDAEQLCVKFRYLAQGTTGTGGWINITFTILLNGEAVEQVMTYRGAGAISPVADTGIYYMCGDVSSGSSTQDDVSIMMNISSGSSSGRGFSVNFYDYELYVREQQESGNWFKINNSLLVNGINTIFVDDGNNNYWTRTFIRNIGDTNQSIDAYLLSRSSNYVVSVITVADTSGQGVSNVQVDVERLLSGSYTPVTQFITDSAGTGSAYLLLNYPYRLATTYQGTTYYANINAQSGYTFFLNETIEINFTSMFDGITINVSPQTIGYNVSLTTYNVTFEFGIHSNKTNMTVFGMNIYCNGSSIFESNSSGFGGQITQSLDIAGCDNVTLNYYFQKAGYPLYWNTIEYDIAYQYPYGISEALRRLVAEYDTGTLNFLVIIILIVVAGALMIISPEVASLTSILVMGALTYYGLLSTNIFILISITLFSIMLIKRRWL